MTKNKGGKVSALGDLDSHKRMLTAPERQDLEVPLLFFITAIETKSRQELSGRLEKCLCRSERKEGRKEGKKEARKEWNFWI